MLEAHVRVLRGDFEHRVHVSERGAHDEVVTVAGELVEHCDSFCTFRHILESRHGDAELALHELDALLVLVRPAGVTWHAEVDDSGLDHAVVLGWRRGFFGGCFSRLGDFFSRLFVTAARCDGEHRHRCECCSPYLSLLHFCSPFGCETYA